VKKNRLSILALALFVSGCSAVGPDYRREEPPVPARFSAVEPGIARGDPVPGPFLDSWWSVFEDSLLESLMERLVSRNLDLRVAAARLMQVRAQLGVTSSALLPDGELTGEYQRLRRDEASVLGAAATAARGREQNFFLAGFDASWEIDIFGGIRRQIEAASADLAASEEALRDALVSLRGELARNYFELRGLQQRIDITRQEIRTRRDNVEITRERAAAGLTSELDQARASGELASAEARIPELERSLKAAVFRIGVLLGQEPSSLETELRVAGVLPAVPPDLPVGLPSELLRRRPDIRKAERELAAATARIGVSTADLFPRFLLTGAFGYQSSEGRILFQDSSNFWAFGPTLRWPILNFLRILSQIDVTKAVREEVLARYEQSVLLALEEVENALVALSREKNRSGSLAEAVGANNLAVKLAMDRYLAGVESYLAVTDAEAALFAAEDQLARSREAQALALVALYKALGGGWPETVSSPGAGPDLMLRPAAPVGTGLMNGRTNHSGWELDE
jgi:NodT family efflux transporter outer membrane factor (OMF) lipoprotein